jgi:drug/metabolite transporter (DMT)-like permease
LLLCCLWSFASVRADLLPVLSPNPMPRMERQVAPLVLLAMTATLFALVRRAPWPGRRQAWSCVLVGGGLFAAPGLLPRFAEGWVPALAQVALFALTPVFAAVLEPHLGSAGTVMQTRGSLVAALVALTGMVCIFPVEIPQSTQAGFAFCAVVAAAACVAAANCVAVRLAHAMPGRSAAPLAAIAGAAAAAGLAATSALTEQPVWSWSALKPELAWSGAIELPGLLLLFWLMRRLSAARMTARFVLAPLLTSLIGLALLRPSVELRAGIGLLLAAVGATWIIFAPEEDGESGASTLKLTGK